MSLPARERPLPSPELLGIRTLSPGDVDEQLVGQWRDLEARALEDNVYLSPDFVLPAMRHLEPQGEPLLIAAFEGERATRLVGLGLFRAVRGDRRFPLAHLAAFTTRYSYLTGLLVDAELAGPVLERFFRFLRRPGSPWHGITFSDWRTDGPLGRAVLRTAQGAGASWHPESRFQRAALVPRQLTEQSFETALAQCSGRDWRKKTLRMIAQDELRWRFLAGSACDPAAVERFLQLEDRGWVKERSSSLLAAGHADFFRELCRGFARRQRIFFTELLLGDEVIASTSNFVSGSTGFAFKIGWNTDHARLRPGLLNELMFLRSARAECAALGHIDSGTQEGSFIETLWGERLTLESGALALTRLGHVAATTCDVLRRAKRAATRLATGRRSARA
jgi:CelD/BcsL family acetyltransferase involved in cellulose biosynthesis